MPLKKQLHNMETHFNSNNDTLSYFTLRQENTQMPMNNGQKEKPISQLVYAVNGSSIISTLSSFICTKGIPQQFICSFYFSMLVTGALPMGSPNARHHRKFEREHCHCGDHTLLHRGTYFITNPHNNILGQYFKIYQSKISFSSIPKRYIYTFLFVGLGLYTLH